MDINIEKNQGLVFGIKKALVTQGYDTSNTNNSVWSKVMEEVSKENEENIKSGGDKIYTGGSNFRGSGRTNFIVKEGIIKFSQNLWNKIVSLVTGNTTDTNKTTNTTNNSTNTTQAQEPHIKNQEMINKIKTEPTTEGSETRLETPSDVFVDPVLKANIEEARDFLLNELNNLSDTDLQQMGISRAKCDRIQEYLKNITFDTDHDSAQAMGVGIVFSTNISLSDTASTTEMVTLLMHEANHCDENFLKSNPEYSEIGDLRHRDENGNPIAKKSVNTKEEERACETLGLLTTATLIKKGVITGENPLTGEKYEDWGRYGGCKEEGRKNNPVTEYLTNPKLLNTDITNWVDGYTNYPEGINDASITIEHAKGDNEIHIPEMSEKIELKNGDVIKIGEKEYPLNGTNNGVVLSALDSMPMLQMVLGGGNLDYDPENGAVNGIIIFDGIQPSPEERAFYQKQNSGEEDCFWFEKADTQTFTVYRDGKPLTIDGKIVTGKIYNYNPDR